MNEKKELKRLFVLIPRTGGTYMTKFVESSWNLLSGYNQMLLLREYGIQFNVCVNRTMPICQNRNKLIDIALQGKEFTDSNGKKQTFKADYAMFLDTDQTFQPDAINRLMKQMIENDLDCISGVYHLKSGKHEPIFGRYVEPTNKHYRPTSFYPSDLQGGDKRLFEVDVVGMGCFLMNMRIFEKYNITFGEKGYFHYTKNPRTKYIDASEDMAFCKQLRDKGVKIWIDPTVQCGHITEVVVDEQAYVGTRDNWLKSLSPRDKKLYYEHAHDLREKDNEKTPQLVDAKDRADWVSENLDSIGEYDV